MNLHGVAGMFWCVKSECSAKNNAGFGRIMTFSTVNMKEKSVLLTSNVSEVDGLSVGVEQLDDGVVVVFHPAADDGCLALDHRDIIRHQVLTLHCNPEKTQHLQYRATEVRIPFIFIIKNNMKTFRERYFEIVKP